MIAQFLITPTNYPACLLFKACKYENNYKIKLKKKSQTLSIILGPFKVHRSLQFLRTLGSILKFPIQSMPALFQSHGDFPVLVNFRSYSTGNDFFLWTPDSTFFTMQLVSNDSHEEEITECEPILCQSDISQRPTESSSSREITDVLGDFPATDEESQILDVNENSKLVSAEQPQCRICLDAEEGEDLIAPCHCRGTQKYVHRSCLDNWRSTKEGFAFAHCTECRAVFILRANVPPDRWWLRLKFQFLVARDHAFIFIIVQLIVAFLGVMVYKFYGDELREMFGYEEHPYGFYTMAVLAIVLVGLLYGFFIAIICGQRINERHYHVLAKQELTKEYVVEDREDNKNAPELDPSHVTELRMLGLY